MSYDTTPLFTEHDTVRAVLVAQDIPATLWQDGTSGGLLCVSVPLTNDDAADEYAPRVLISTEGEEVVTGHGGARWFATLDNVGADEQHDLCFTVPQRQGETLDSVADRYATVLRLLRAGSGLIDTASSASRQHSIDTGRFLLKGEAFVG